MRLLTALTRDKQLGPHVVPIIPDEARTFGMEGLFRTLGIYSSIGQLYDPVDADQVMYYHEDKKGQVLEEGITEAGSMCSWIAAGTSYSCHGLQMIPFYIFYSMFGFQRIGDLAWAAGDNQARGFLLGATSGRTTLSGEGLQHQDGHSQLMAATIPNCRAYDPTYAYELAVILHEGLLRMVRDHENVFYYITLMNENYTHPPMPEGVREGILRGMYRIRDGGGDGEAAGPAARLGHDPARGAGGGGAARSGLAGGGRRLELHQHERAAPRRPRLRALEPAASGGAAAPELGRALPRNARAGRWSRPPTTMRAYADQIRPYVAQRYKVLGTDGYGRSDTRRRLRVVLRGGSPLGGDRRAQGAGGRRRAPGRDRQQRDLPLRNRREEAESGDGVVADRSAGDPVASERQVLVPDIGDFHDVEVIEVLVAVGDTVAADQTLITLESDKATMEIPSPAAGVVQVAGGRARRQAERGLADRDARGGERRRPPRARPRRRRRRRLRPPQAPPAAARPRSEPPAAAPPVARQPAAIRSEARLGSASARAGERRQREPEAPRRGAPAAHASPSVRRLARELGVDLSRVTGSGRKHRVRTEDVQAFVKSALAAGAPASPLGSPGGAAAGHRLREVRRRSRCSSCRGSAASRAATCTAPG